MAIGIALLAMSASGVLWAQEAIQNAKDNGTDRKFHKFQPAVQPEAAVVTGTTQAESGAVTTQQITALEQEKASRTPVQQKIDSNILYTVRMLAGKEAAPGILSLNTGVDVDESNNLMVDITANVTSSLLQQLNAAGVQVWYSNERFRSVRAVVPSTQIESIAALPDVIFISPKVESITASARWFLPGPLQLPRKRLCTARGENPQAVVCGHARRSSCERNRTGLGDHAGRCDASCRGCARNF